MNCPICGGPYILGGSDHKACRELKAQKDADERVMEQIVEDLLERIERLEDRVFTLERGY